MANNDIETRVNEMERKQVGIETKLDAFIQEMRDFKTEMRQQNEMRAAEIRELRQEMKQTVARIESKVDSVNQYAHQMFIAAAIGIGAMILTVVVPMIMSPK